MNPIPSKAQLAARRVLVVGDVMLDRYWHGAVDRISPEAPVPVVRVEREELRLGGAANVALNVRTLGAQATLLTVVGQDEAAQQLRQLLHQHDIATVLRDDKQLHTIVKLRVIGRAQQLIRIDFENEPDHEVLSQMLDAFEEQLPSHDLVLFSDYGKGGLTHIPRMIELARRAGKPVLIDPKGNDYRRYAGASVITPNRGELAQVTGPWKSELDLLAKVDRLRSEIDVDAVLLTRSEEGMTLFDAGGVTHEPARAREVFDVTGAGDTVIATLAALLAAQLPLAQAMRLANKAGGIVVGKFGTATVSYEELAA
ncbi:MAG: D-glycero-beta-D-manno-heptose-7-phosphate kinase [Proteobacteria bacterium]|jgi:rfaE bifunctional protein kinase chain/domain|nr:D-glycero-beta-D-manno-heptose-7-phosphate kinase [Methylibium sp.]MBY0367963.1 D-glycero-beta-D-manno-heptose-7-phosphate kinase [Burkholderiaceae bacterium]MCH8857527.1 D-glycero-beta-D-manno-heptose-7-phosphate kinase [Pseudomonadota bacterium]|mmetsp:Transcript_10440/g.42571  ORF Transcript_10440/g.42571 Transcript_10440/m.42571 type:complete len:312 (-) Transcript_10440:458-1393(-)